MSFSESISKAFSQWKSTTPLHLLDRVHSQELFQRILQCERMRSDRSGSAFSVVVFSFESVDALSQFALYLQPRVRATDHLGLLGPTQVGIVLWNTSHDGATVFVDHILQSWPSSNPPQHEIFLYPTYVAPSSDATNDTTKDAGNGKQESGHNLDGNGSSDVAAPNEYATSAHGQIGSDQKKTEFLADQNQETFVAGSSSLETLIQGPKPDALALGTEKQILQSLEKAETLLASAQQAELTSHPVGQPLEQLFIQPLPITKRIIDIIGVSVGLIVLSPLLCLTAILIKVTSPGPIFFCQKRDGLGGVPFTIYKFRTMVTDAEAQKASLRSQSEQDGPAFKLEHDPRITPIGKFLRKSCIDELPQLWNVLKGDMTIVGPRPLDCKEAQHISGWGRRRLEVTPGLTCIWQVHGKSRVTFAEWMRMDIRYMKARTFCRDVKLMCETFVAVLLNRASH